MIACWSDLQFSFVIVVKPDGPWSSSTGSATGLGTPKFDNEGPMARTITCLGTASRDDEPTDPNIVARLHQHPCRQVHCLRCRIWCRTWRRRRWCRRRRPCWARRWTMRCRFVGVGVGVGGVGVGVGDVPPRRNYQSRRTPGACSGTRSSPCLSAPSPRNPSRSDNSSQFEPRCSIL